MLSVSGLNKINYNLFELLEYEYYFLNFIIGY